MTKLTKLFSLLALLLITACSKNTVDRDDLVVREGVLYEKFATQPFSGLVEGNVSGVVEDGKWEGTVYKFDGDGNVILESNYVNGLREGSEIVYGRYGRRAQERTFAQGDLTNFKRFFDGVMQINENFKDQEKHGVQEFFCDNESLMYRVNYDSGEPIEDVLDVYSKDAKTHLQVPFIKASYPERGRLVAHGVVKVAGDDTCSVEYDKGHRTPATEALPSLAGIEQRLATADCFVTVGTIIDDVGLNSIFVKDLFPVED